MIVFEAYFLARIPSFIIRTYLPPHPPPPSSKALWTRDKKRHEEERELRLGDLTHRPASGGDRPMDRALEDARDCCDGHAATLLALMAQ